MSDSISRTDAIRWVKTECNPYGLPTLDYDSGLRVIEHLKNMPSALPSAEAYTEQQVRDAFNSGYSYGMEQTKEALSAEATKMLKGKDAKVIVIDASAEAEWIPCSERLPSEDGEYLVQMSWWGFQMDVYSWADGWNCYRINGKVSRLSEIDGRDIVAWMPLPKPYREDGEV